MRRRTIDPNTEPTETPAKSPSFPVLAAAWVPKLRAVQTALQAMAVAATQAERAAAETNHALARTAEAEAWAALEQSRKAYLAVEVSLPDAASLPEALSDPEPTAPAA